MADGSTGQMLPGVVVVVYSLVLCDHFASVVGIGYPEDDNSNSSTVVTNKQ